MDGVGDGDSGPVVVIFYSFGMVFDGDVSDGLFLCFVVLILLAGVSALVIGIFFDKRIENRRAQRRLEKEAGHTPKPARKPSPLDDFGKI